MYKKEIEAFEKEIRTFKTDRAATAFVDNAVRKRAAKAGLPYQRFIRLTLERAIAGSK